MKKKGRGVKSDIKKFLTNVAQGALSATLGHYADQQLSKPVDPPPEWVVEFEGEGYRLPKGFKRVSVSKAKKKLRGSGYLKKALAAAGLTAATIAAIVKLYGSKSAKAINAVLSEYEQPQETEEELRRFLYGV